MQEELDALRANQTWKVVLCQATAKPIGCKWVYSDKFKSDGSLGKYKVRFVALGNRHKCGIN